MIRKFLETYQEELISSKIDYNEELDLVRTKIKENEKFMDVLSAGNDSIFTDFTPREVSIRNKDKIEEISNALKTEYAKRDSLISSISFVDSKLKELENIFKELNQEMKPSVYTGSVTSSEKNKSSIDHTMLHTAFTKEMVQCDRIQNFLKLDPERSRTELLSLKQSIAKIDQLLNP